MEELSVFEWIFSAVVFGICWYLSGCLQRLLRMSSVGWRVWLWFGFIVFAVFSIELNTDIKMFMGWGRLEEAVKIRNESLTDLAILVFVLLFLLPFLADHATRIFRRWRDGDASHRPNT